MTAITISRQLGSLGDEVASAIANQLDYRVVSREGINQAALRAKTPEVALATIDDLGLFGLRPSAAARRAYLQAIQETMREVAAKGQVVIIGRAGQVILRGYPDVLHIKVIAPAALRAERIALAQAITIKAAHSQIEASDRARRNFLKRYYNARWDDPDLYDLIINTARLEPIDAARLVCQALNRCNWGVSPDLNAHTAREPDIERATRTHHPPAARFRPPI